MKLYNTLLESRKVEDFTPLEDNTVRMYSCGPTVYNHAHIGNLGSYVYFDTLRRVLKQLGYDVKHVMNYTDIDDKTIRRSRELFADDEPAVALKKLGDKYIETFNGEMRQTGNNLDDMTFIRATDPKVIWGMQDLTAKLHQKGFAYIADDGVYFSIEAYRKAGKTYGQLLEITAGNTSEARIQNDEYDKESVHDFALWKKQKDGEPAWDFMLDGQNLNGRPGWHIECSVMSRQLLGQPFDIHTGGVDLVFPHHENEVAQSTALEDNPVMAAVFLHNEHMLVNGKKMSKSLGNFHTLEDIIKKGYDPLAFRLKVLQSHYRSQINFTWESLEAAQTLLQKLRAWADLKHQKAAKDNEQLGDFYKEALQNVLAAAQDDLDTPKALELLAKLAASETVEPEKIQPLLNVLDRLFGLQLAERPDVTRQQKNLLAERERARKAKDWPASDKLRKQLTSQGLGVRDTSSGPIWYRV